VKNDKSPVVPALLKEPSATQFLRDTNVTIANTRSSNYPEKDELHRINCCNSKLFAER
jgi:hypothetical protein